MHRRYGHASLAMLAMLLVLSWTSAAAAAAQHRALLIANGVYSRLAPAPTALSDMEAAAVALRGLGYDVAAHVNLDERSMWRALRRFFQSIGADDTAVLYFSGRAVDLGGVFYLAPVDLDPGAKFASRALLVQEAFLGLERSTAKHGLFVLNASDAAGGATLATTEGEGSRTALFVAPPGAAHAAGGGDLSAFGAAFAEALAIRAPTVGTIARRVEAALSKAGGRKATLSTPQDFRIAPLGLALEQSVDLQSGGAGRTASPAKPKTRQAYRRSQKERALPSPTAAPVQSARRPASALPAFPWPPPKPSAFSVIPRRLIAGGGEGVLFGDVARRIEAALFQANYAERSYLAAPGGFALVTRTERILADGRPDMERRWFGAKAADAFSLKRFIQELFLGDPGRYRVIVFVATDRDFAATGAAIDAAAVESLLQSGLLTLPRSLAALPFTADHGVTALVYEFERPEGGQATQVQPSPIDGIVHLRGAQLLQALEGR